MHVVIHQTLFLLFRYTLLESPDNQVGVRSDTGEWTGLIGMLERKELDLIVGPVSMTHDRDSVLDFSYPFHTDQYGVLYKRIDPASMKWRLFMEPFKWRVWVCVAISIPFVAMVIWAMNKTSPYYTVAERNTGFGNFTEALLFTYGSLCQQGGVYQPAALSGRFVVGFWWVFAIASVATYTGNLIAFLTVSIDFKPFKSVQEMVVGKHSYGFVGGTDLEDLLEVRICVRM
ncbi:hypothetical protein CAPTEDRAFT_107912 [Capitella teleta]|uniref:Ionotropic glutamate receptor L-glutamate and glycine-binding domain-containing protein n=1 Tax=Capitella teleta TaxID=283909 RepID=R7V5L4_CAPTE|nr:hypothetical protein CAPTEDRAFT_107912 [Capitella teleta]|eukprot:ELU13859.1 hypothetical protein CAPTEDRAFT_107912 [Capitella teleta]